MKLLLMVVLGFFIQGPVFSADPLENLIDGEKKAREEWTEEAEELPPAFLWGDKNAVALNSLLICQPLSFDELIEISQGDPSDKETILNLDIPRVREIIQGACLVRPKDPLFVIGEGNQQRVTFKNFVVRRDRPVCSSESPFSLWGSFDETLKEIPIFFSTTLTWPEGENQYAKEVEQKPLALEGILRQKLAEKVNDQREYRLWTVEKSSSNVERFLILRRATAQLEDDKLPNEILLAETAGEIESLWMERVDISKGSGHLRIEATLDFNGDGLLDLLLSGDHQGCPYRMAFEGSLDGFHPVDLPLNPCGCP